jgi:hypothetical protein
MQQSKKLDDKITTRLHPMTKRQRCEVPTWWAAICDEIRSTGGQIHDSLHFDESNRVLTLMNNVAVGSVLMSIPRKGLITKDRAVRLCPWLETNATNHISIMRGLANSIADLWIAVALASESPDNLLYLQSLPEPSSFDALPRRWSDDHLDDLLGGTSLLERAKAAKRDLVSDYSLLKTMFGHTASDSVEERGREQKSFPSFERFSVMLAAVSSRAFQVGETDQDVAIVPLLDLCDHARGVDSKKNVSYEIQDDGGMLVKSIVPLCPGDRLKLTYGALGNTHLLLNYGFCIPHNLEPDGSSNDVLEIQIPLSSSSGKDPQSCKRIFLRTGPKSYSYGAFASAVELFLVHRSSEELNEGNDDDPEDGLDDFLEDGDNDDNSKAFDDIYDGESVIDGSDKSVESDTIGVTKTCEINALTGFRRKLIHLSEGYSLKGPELRKALSMGPCTQFYSAVLCQSELRTISFFIRAIDKVQGHLDNAVTHIMQHVAFCPSEDDLSLIEEQTTALAAAYIAIRHGTLKG